MSISLNDRQKQVMASYWKDEQAKFGGSRREFALKVGVDHTTIRTWQQATASRIQGDSLDAITRWRSLQGHTPANVEEWLRSIAGSSVVADAIDRNPEDEDFFSVDERLNEIDALARALVRAVLKLQEDLSREPTTMNMHPLGILIRATARINRVSLQEFAQIINIEFNELQRIMHQEPTKEQLDAIAAGINTITGGVECDAEALREILNSDSANCRGDRCCRNA